MLYFADSTTTITAIANFTIGSGDGTITLGQHEDYPPRLHNPGSSDVGLAVGFGGSKDDEACEKVGIEPYVPRPQRGPSVKAGLFRKDEFTYDTVGDNDICPAGQRLHPYSSSLLRGLKKVNYVNKLACDDCAIRLRCTGASFARHGAKIAMDWSDVVGGITGKFLPTGNVKDTIEVDGIK